MQETQARSLSQEDPLEKGMATHSSILAWRIPWTEEPGKLCSSWGRKELDMTEQPTHTHTRLSLQLKNFRLIKVKDYGAWKLWGLKQLDWHVTGFLTQYQPLSNYQYHPPPPPPLPVPPAPHKRKEKEIKEKWETTWKRGAPLKRCGWGPAALGEEQPWLLREEKAGGRLWLLCRWLGIISHRLHLCREARFCRRRVAIRVSPVSGTLSRSQCERSHSSRVVSQDCFRSPAHRASSAAENCLLVCLCAGLGFYVLITGLSTYLICVSLYSDPSRFFFGHFAFV